MSMMRKGIKPEKLIEKSREVVILCRYPLYQPASFTVENRLYSNWRLSSQVYSTTNVKIRAFCTSRSYCSTNVLCSGDFGDVFAQSQALSMSCQK